MCPLIILLFLVTCNLSTSIDIYNEDDGSYEIDFQNDDFFQSIRNFFHNLKNQIHDRLFGRRTVTVPPVLLPTEVLQLDKSELQKRLGTHEWHPLDLSTLVFDPEKDWGFRIGNWYFIRKQSIDEGGFHRNSDGPNFQYPSTSQPKTSVKIETEETFDAPNDLGTESSSSTLEMHVTPSMTQRSDSETTTSTNEPIDSSENSSLVTNVSKLGNSENASDLFVEAP